MIFFSSPREPRKTDFHLRGIPATFFNFVPIPASCPRIPRDSRHPHFRAHFYWKDSFPKWPVNVLMATLNPILTHSDSLTHCHEKNHANVTTQLFLKCSFTNVKILLKLGAYKIGSLTLLASARAVYRATWLAHSEALSIRTDCTESSVISETWK